MAYEIHTRISLSGIVTSDVAIIEEFSMTFNTEWTVAPTQAKVDAVAALASTWWTSAGMAQDQDHYLTEVKASLCDATNHVVGDPVVSALTGVNGAVERLHPPQIAVRVSLNGDGRGRSKQGGFYVPGTGQSMNSDFRLYTASAAALAATTHTFLAGVEAIPFGRVCVASGVLGNVPVTLIRVGDVFDTIRRRRDELPEAYSSVALA